MTKLRRIVLVVALTALMVAVTFVNSALSQPPGEHPPAEHPKLHACESLASASAAQEQQLPEAIPDPEQQGKGPPEPEASSLPHGDEHSAVQEVAEAHGCPGAIRK